MTSSFKLDEDFEYFLEKFSTPFEQVPCSTEIINRYKGKLPSRLLEYWREYGFCGFHDGIFWIVNPEDFEDIVDEWLSPTDIPDHDIYHVFARNAFGDLFLWGEETGQKYKLSTSKGWIIEREGDPRSEHNSRIEWFFGGQTIDLHDIDDEDDNPLFEQCVKNLGALKSDEIFGFVPSLIAGGETKLENIHKVNVFVHLSLLAQFGQIEVLDKNALRKKAFGL
ncbi:glutamyl-tRNA amidotransferase [Vibrio vulnificus]|uniref:GAD-like domain-containing protein n=1 Tax=Vibrio vulnificus TaxID=672 RepID=UPI00034CF52C|nr:GAD-like domain-containing protein [Vibrio vulnificus]EWS66844.1 glutamyl-tRNA amidotransferase [Vibrio vulnificus BAA87]KFK57965.1 glutamyl-tRNA amidotransferase [Vibrio vulnificus]KFK64224.1 glutamyl-tRNA amidotransferase [Vibrio vulnificus]KFK67603.1 glutamyl-tRNA amidotransferase [Vibrio vulnificus]KOR97414.1 glutamyl-tRNA amidotransferase [Vibrio vulnificus]